MESEHCFSEYLTLQLTLCAAIISKLKITVLAKKKGYLCLIVVGQPVYC